MRIGREIDHLADHFRASIPFEPLEYNHAMDAKPLLPDRERLSAVMAVILLAYVAARLVQVPGQTLALELAGIYLPLQLNLDTAIALVVAGLTATGTDWLLQSEEGQGDRPRYRHWLLPAMTAWVVSLVLTNLPLTASWWLALVASALVLLVVILAEFASSNSGHRYHTLATQALTILIFGLFLVLAITVRGTALRLFLALPSIGIGVATAASRLQLLHPTYDWQPLQIVGITFVCVEVAAALHYLPLSAIGYGLALLGLVYALNHYVSAVNAGEELRQPIREAVLSLAMFWFLAVLVR